MKCNINLILNLIRIFLMWSCCLPLLFTFGDGAAMVESTIQDILNLIGNGTSCKAVLFTYLGMRSRHGQLVKHALKFNPNAWAEASALDQHFASTKAFRGPLHCVPVVLQDNIDVVGMPTTVGYAAMNKFFPVKDAHLVQQLKHSGAIVIAKSSMLPFGIDIKMEELIKYDEYEKLMVINPFDRSRYVAGSGAALAVSLALNVAVIGIGVDADGSSLLAASLTGLFCLRTNMGMFRMDGIFPISIPQDAISLTARHPADIAMVQLALTTGLFRNHSNWPAVPQLHISALLNVAKGADLTQERHRIDAIYHNSIKTLRDLGMSVDLRLVDDLEQTVKNLKLEESILIQRCYRQWLDRYLADNLRIVKEESLITVNSYISLIDRIEIKLPSWIKYKLIERLHADNSICYEYEKRFHSARVQLIEKFNTFRNGAQLIMLPSFTYLPTRVVDLEMKIIDSQPDFINSRIPSCLGFPALSLPVGFVGTASEDEEVVTTAGVRSSNSQRQLSVPFSILLIARPGQVSKLINLGIYFNNRTRISELFKLNSMGCKVKMPFSANIIVSVIATFYVVIVYYM